MLEPPQFIRIRFCPSCGWDDMAWGPDFWQRHREEGEERTILLPCLDGGEIAQTKIYVLTSEIEVVRNLFCDDDLNKRITDAEIHDALKQRGYDVGWAAAKLVVLDKQRRGL